MCHGLSFAACLSVGDMDRKTSPAQVAVAVAADGASAHKKTPLRGGYLHSDMLRITLTRLEWGDQCSVMEVRL
jgi:hypothetical protein